MWKLICLTSLFTLVSSADDIPAYIKQCKQSDPELTRCIRESLHHLRPYLAKGIPEIELPSVEPFVMDLLSLQLTGGPQGYRINLKHLEVFGASNFTIKAIKLANPNEPFEAIIAMPRLVIKAKYTSSGVLIIIPASGSGDFNAVFEGVTCNVKGVLAEEKKAEGTFLKVENLAIDLVIRKPRLSVSKIFNNNRILNEATNLFLKENGHEILKAMQPQLQKKLSSEFTGIANQLLKHVPREKFVIE